MEIMTAGMGGDETDFVGTSGDGREIGWEGVGMETKSAGMVQFYVLYMLEAYKANYVDSCWQYSQNASSKLLLYNTLNKYLVENILQFIRINFTIFASKVQKCLSSFVFSLQHISSHTLCRGFVQQHMHKSKHKAQYCSKSRERLFL